eukprot:CAMPEP_0115866256 /NCGR_PEP_ID=MMETSP0287-20121206/20155_1 /TAXON_ID=412157 /ORGANISM="Chrysochromulina rotalis, Strain UIO044" /LENGTH=106 /DNA_ID=CAMNT_0003320817 /DNA_START=28 /DNA_END=347 /DNA_ORIENTATION=-
MGMGRMAAGIFSGNQQVVLGTAGICVAGLAIGFSWFGYSRMAAASSSGNQQVVLGTAGICVAGLAIGFSWFGYIADRKPGTLKNPAWAAATAKYRAAQNQDPITNQ